MPTRWTSGACHCILIVDPHPNGKDYVLLDWEQKCDLHKDLEGDALALAVLEHHRRHTWNEKLTPEEVARNIQSEKAKRKVALRK